MLPQSERNEHSLVHVLVLDTRDSMEVVHFYNLYLHRQIENMSEAEEQKRLVNDFPSFQAYTEDPHLFSKINSSTFMYYYYPSLIVSNSFRPSINPSVFLIFSSVIESPIQR